ncbi:carboxy-S-adenosyl-L-methionine synthase CmoA [Magnetovirga frankeli]|uniref:carboxy-S-adenosyl-L-methionine synthase CmoA n=1 Tax=Magnetovirga frankeli TaxID=947516 RepID=UPI003D32B057
MTSVVKHPAKPDRIYAEPLAEVTDFVFDERVAAVFPDMINRSVPGYATIIRMIGLLAAERVPVGGRCYDLGCSLGAAALAMSRGGAGRQIEVIAVDNSAAMIRRAGQLLQEDQSASKIQLHCADIQDFPLKPAAMVVLNFTLQFIPLPKRVELLERIHQALDPGGLLLLSEKITFEQAEFEQLFSAMHHQFKRDQGYSQLEISQKRTALERVLLPETLHSHRQRLLQAGFRQVETWFQCFNFVSLIALKPNNHGASGDTPEHETSHGGSGTRD